MFRFILLLYSLSASHATAAARPNFVVILADDLGYCDTSLYGCDQVPTPAIDRIAREGVSFTDAYVTAGTCSPSRAALLTGRYQQRFGFEFNTGPARITEREQRGLSTDEVTIAEVLKVQGYRTALVGKWHQGTVDRFHPNERGFDFFYGFLPGARPYFDEPPSDGNPTSRRVNPLQPEYRPARPLNTMYRNKQRVKEPEYLTDALAREAAAYIRANREFPFFLYLAFNAPHTPIEATREYVDRFPDEENLLRRTYMGMISALDDGVGKVLDALDEAGLTNDTVVVFLSDNGCAIDTEACTNDPLRLGKLFLFEGGIRVPFAMRYPEVLQPGQTYTQPVSSLDLFPTMLTLAGSQRPTDKHLDGVDLLPFVTGRDNNAPHEDLFWRNGSNKAMRSGPWKLFWNERQTWLFNLSEDLGEVNNLADDKKKLVDSMKKRYENWEADKTSPAWPYRSTTLEYKVDGVKIDIFI
ncbi:sulfatase [Acidobacteria bacterium AH-259-L09]|nr:sulfatase [Acidobacteria bacterium AH-259-L09]